MLQASKTDADRADRGTDGGAVGHQKRGFRAWGVSGGNSGVSLKALYSKIKPLIGILNSIIPLK